MFSGHIEVTWLEKNVVTGEDELQTARVPVQVNVQTQTQTGVEQTHTPIASTPLMSRLIKTLNSRGVGGVHTQTQTQTQGGGNRRLMHV